MSLYQTRTVIVGSFYHKGATEKLAHLKVGDSLLLVREPSNKFDANAVAIHEPKSNQMLGHIPRNHAPLIATHLDCGASMKVVLVSKSDNGIMVSWSTNKPKEN